MTLTIPAEALQHSRFQEAEIQEQCEHTSGRTIGEIVKSLYAFMNLKTLLVIKFCPNWKKTKTKRSPTVQMTSTELL